MSLDEATWDARHKCIRLGKTVARGLRPSLQEAFFPHFDYKELVRNKGCKSTGKKFGKGLDEAFDKYLMGIIPKHPYFKMFKELLDQKGWRPVDTQVTVGCARARVGTRVDLVCLDATDRVILLELKTGYESYLDKSSGKMLSPFQETDASPKYINLMQLFFTKWMFLNSKHYYSTHEFGKAYLLWGHNTDQLDIHEIPAEWDALLEPALTVLESKKDHTVKRRKRSMAYHRAKRRKILQKNQAPKRKANVEKTESRYDLNL